MRLLLVEDDPQLSKSLSIALKNDGFTLLSVSSGEEAIVSAQFDHIDIVILDLGLPDLDGLVVLQKIKRKSIQCKVLVLTARDQVSSKVQCLNAGADDYLVKPFEYDELAARIRVLERNLTQQDQPTIQIGPLNLDPAGLRIKLNNEELSLSKKEYMLLKALMESAGRIQTKEALEAKLYDFGEEAMSNSIEVHIHNIRKKIPVGFIKTVRGIGYLIKKSP